MNVDKIEVGTYKCNCYILKKNNKIIIIDPGDEYEKILNKIENNDVIAILITHSHFDHIGALNNFIKDYSNIPVYKYANLEEKEYTVGGFKFRVIYTQGHTDDSVSYYFYEDNIMFTGDFIFNSSIGRCDFENSSIDEMKKSILKIKKINKNIILYPGHGDKTTLDKEKQNNFYFNNEWN